eukprot:114062-Hanusia_phi.AAC.1
MPPRAPAPPRAAPLPPALLASPSMSPPSRPLPPRLRLLCLCVRTPPIRRPRRPCRRARACRASGLPAAACTRS